MRGVKLIPHYQGYPEEGPLVDVPCRYADQHGLLILNHSWGSAEQMERLCATYPRACFIAGHSTTAYVEVARRHPNLFICTCPFHNWGQTEEFVELYGAERIMFGSDLLDLPIAWGMGQIMYARIPEEAKRKILGENLRGLLEGKS
jgi:predicted TIM-barrel fold metal-dependent hydrolase